MARRAYEITASVAFGRGKFGRGSPWRREVDGEAEARHPDRESKRVRLGPSIYEHPRAFLLALLHIAWLG
jgi:hypothetical protein